MLQSDNLLCNFPMQLICFNNHIRSGRLLPRFNIVFACRNILHIRNSFMNTLPLECRNKSICFFQGIGNTITIGFFPTAVEIILSPGISLLVSLKPSIHIVPLTSINKEKEFLCIVFYELSPFHSIYVFQHPSLHNEKPRRRKLVSYNRMLGR